MRYEPELLYVFYYLKGNKIDKKEVETRLCRRPRATKVYQDLEGAFYRGEIDGFGFDVYDTYTDFENDPTYQKA